MKKLTALMLFLIVAVGALMGADKPEITFATTAHDFGNIPADGGRVTCRYEFTNTGTAPLLIINVSNGGCGCTTPSFPKHPIKPGEKGAITITFDPSGRRGELNRTVRVSTNASKKSYRLRFSGVVVP